MVAGPDLSAFVPRLLLERPLDAPRHWQTDGSLALIDISGFTSLSEQLARRGRVGAEDLVSTLTRIFTVIMSATDDGGDVVKFAGDALLMLFRGSQHQRHAAHAARAAHQVLDVVGRLNLSGATARLRMSVGVHSGPVELLLTGTDHLNLVVCGPTVGRLLALQDQAQPGQVLVSDEIADALPPSSVRGRVGDGLLLGRLPVVEAAGTTMRAATVERDMSRWLPRSVASRADLLVADSDHRRAAMGFVHVSGLDLLLRDRNGDALAVVDHLSAEVDAACAEAGVSLLDTDLAGDGYRYFLTAGAPHAVEDPEGRLLRALVRITASDTPLSLRAGASAGQVFAGPVGATFRRTYSVMGDTTNLAARLTSRAPAGGVLAHAPMVRRATNLLATTEHDPVVVKGKAAPIPVHVVTGVGARRDRREAVRDFVGRDGEAARIVDLVARARDGHGGVLEIRGEAGLGKSRLADEAARRAGLEPVWISSDPYGALVPYGLLRTLARRLLGLAEADGPATSGRRVLEMTRDWPDPLARWRPLLGPVLDADLPGTAALAELDDRFRSFRFRDAVRGLLTSLLTAPTVLVIDDAQWTDQSSADALAHAWSSLEGWPLVVLLTTRDGDDGLRATQVTDAELLRLEPLPSSVAQDVVAGASRLPLRESQVQEILDRAGGNPYFMIELAGSPTGEEVPDTVEELVGLRIDDLDGSTRDMLRQAAVLGSRFSPELYAETTGGAFPEAAAMPLGLADFVVPGADGTVQFRREIHREVAYAQLTFRRRREIHRHAVAAIERNPELAVGPHLPLLSLHASAAGSWSDAYRFSLEAAAEARAFFANEEAAVFCRRALAAGRRSGVGTDDLRPTELQLGDVLTFDGQHDEAVAALRRARRGIADPAAAAEVNLKIGRVRLQANELDACMTTARRVVRLAASTPAPAGTRLRVEADLLRSGVCYWQGRAARCRRLALAAVAGAAELPDDDKRIQLVARAYALHDSAVVELEGRPATYGEQPLEMFRRIGDLYNEGRFSINVGIGYFYAGAWDRAADLYQRALDVAERIGDLYSVAVARMDIGEVRSLQGRSAEAAELLSTSVIALRALGSPLAAAHATCYLGAARLNEGDLLGARAALAESVVLFERSGQGEGHGADELATRQLELELAERHLDTVRTAAGALLARSTPPLAPLHRARTFRTLALAEHVVGEVDAARRSLAQSLDIGTSLALAHEAALSLLVLADWEDSTQAHDEARVILAGLGVRLTSGEEISTA